jgi:hypothetical protein
LLDEIRMLMRGVRHPMRFVGIPRHPRFREDVLAGVEGGARDLAVQIGPGTDTDGVDIRIRDQIVPVRIGLGNP